MKIKKISCIAIIFLICFIFFPPIIFSKNGDYSIATGKQKSAFQKGVLYLRKGSRSIPAKSDDLNKILENEINNRRKLWLGNIKKIIQAPANNIVHVLNKKAEVTFSENGSPFRLTDNPDAPEFRLTNPDTLCPFNTSQTVDIINDKLKGNRKINSYDVLMVRYLYDICDNHEYYYHSLTGASQYSEKFINWVIERFNEDNEFFTKNRTRYRTGK